MAAPAPCCGSCGKTFPSGWEARDQHCEAKGHKKPTQEITMSAPSNSDYFCCGSCEKRFSWDWEEREQHCAVTGHEKPQHECERCSLWFRTQAGADEHMAAVNHWPYVCEYCQRSYQTEPECDAHEAEEHTGGHLLSKAGDVQQVNSNAQCGGDGKSWTSVRRVRIRQPPEKVDCGRCDRSFVNMTALREHGRAKHGIPFYCQQCGQGFETRGAVRRHVQYTPQHGASCPYCHKRFSNSSVLCGHLESGKCEGKGKNAMHLDYHGLYQFIRLKDPFENFTNNFISWTGEKLTRNAKLFLYHCPNVTCKREFKSLQGAMGHLEAGACKFAAKEDVVQKICPDIIHGFKFLGSYPLRGWKGTKN